MKTNNRREFLKLLSGASAAAALSPILMPNELFASSSPQFGDYKALVCVFLNGGNDAFNTVVPTIRSGANGYDNYSDIRSSLIVKHNDLSAGLATDANGRIDLTGGNPYESNDSEEEAYLKGLYHISGMDIGINAVMPELAQLAKDGKVAVLGNIGTLVEPTTKSQIQNKSVTLPINLFAHNHQKRVQETGQADNLFNTGWIGRLYDEWGDVNGVGPIGKNVSFSDNNHMLNGANTDPLVLSTSPHGYDGHAPESLREELSDLVSSSPLASFYNKMIKESFTLSGTLDNIWNNFGSFTTTDAYGESLFNVPSKSTLNFTSDINGSLIKQFKAVAKMIDYGRQNGIKRQIFFIELLGFDTHSSQAENHPHLLREVSLGFDKFQRAMEELGISDKVTAFTLSDFGRTVANNGDGTDHAWAGHNFVVGGAVKGYDSASGISGFYGEMPDLTLQGTQDAGRNGRIIPTLAVDQQLATLTKWFGADDTFNQQLFPNLSNFSATTYGIDIGFMA